MLVVEIDESLVAYMLRLMFSTQVLQGYIYSKLYVHFYRVCISSTADSE